MKKIIIGANNTSSIRRDHARILVGAVVACWLIAAGTARAQYSENFDAYANGSQVIGQGGWQGWDGDTTVGGLVTNAFAFSAPNSVRIRGTALTSGNYSDLVHQFAGISSGQWSFTAKQYIPGNSTSGTSYFIVMSRYADGNPGGNTDVWGSQMTFNLATGGVSDDNGGTSATPTIIRNQWVDLRLDIDLTANTVSEYYNNQLFRTATWASGTPPGIQAIDLYSDVSSPVFYDNISVKRVRVVTTTASTGPGSLTAAINALVDGDTIAFNIPGAGPHYIQTPVDGFPLISKNNITIDGYSQPGASPNTNSIHATNNAQLKICLTSTNGNALAMETACTTNWGAAIPRLGYGDDEQAVLGFFHATNVTIQGLAILSSPLTTSIGVGGTCKSISFAANSAENGGGRCQNWRISGCWFGVDPTTRQVAYMPDGVTVATPGITIASYRTRNAAAPDNTVYNYPGTIGVASSSANPRAEFNVFVTGYGFDAEGLNYRFSGNFLGVLPDGMTCADMSVLNGGAQMGDGFIEIGRDVSNCTVGTDGDGVNDADEGNVFGGIANGSHQMMDFYSSPHTNIVIAGNWFNLAVDGVTRFTNTAFLLGDFASTATVQFGSDFNGVSDALEGNRVYGITNIFSRFFGGSGGSLNVGVRLSFRGNSTVNNELIPYSYANGFGGRLASFTNYEAPYMDTTGSVIPALSPTSTPTNIVGTCATTNGSAYSNIIVDVYVLDSEGWENGKKLALSELTDNATYTNGFPQGKTYLGSFVDNGPLDSNPVLGAFNFNVTSLGLALGTQITVTANYSQDPPGTTRGRTHTSNFSTPVTLTVSGIIYVTTTDNGSPDGLAAAMGRLQNGNTIRFNIPGAGPHYLEPPVGGFPMITAHNVTIDGYSQPGAVPNTNPILSNNNAQIKIVLSATNSVTDELYRDMDYNSGTNSQVGYTPGGEFGLLGVYGATNVEIKGMCFLGSKVVRNYAIALARDVTHPCNGVHVSGCWIGVEPSGIATKVVDLGGGVFRTNLWDFDDCVAAFSHRYEASYTFTGTNNGTPCSYRVTLNNRNPGVWESDRELITLFNATNTACPTATNATFSVAASAIRYIHTNHIIGVKRGSANPRAEFNVLVGSIIPLALEGHEFRISGNFIGVMPDGLHDYVVPFAEPGRFMEGTIEIGRGASDCVVGTDGDGVNDAEERNVFGGVPTGGGGGSKNLGGYQHVVEFYSASGALGSDRTRNRIAGNYCGVAVDGVTRFTNGVPFCNGSTTGASQYWVGSDFDGVSDDVEANVIFNNYPPGLFYNTAYTNSPQGGATSQGFFDQLGNSALVSMRGNVVVNNYPFPVNPGQGTAVYPATNYGSFVTNYMTKAIVSPFTNLFFPLVSTSSTTARITGTVPIGKLPYQYTILDFYLTDPEGLTNGLVVPDPLLTNGWVHGRKYLRSYTIATTNFNTGANLSSAAGTFELNTCDLGLANGSKITVSANYSQDPPGTHNARVLTSLFSPPVTVGPVPA